MKSRVASEKDKKEILELVKSSDNEDIKNLKNWWKAIEYYASVAKNITTTLVYLNDEKKIIGFIYYLHKKNKNVIKLYAIGNLSSGKEKGVGSIMMKELLYYASFIKCPYIEFDSDKRFSGYNFFTKKMGYKPTSKKDETHDYFKVYLNHEQKQLPSA